jgi:hypothetical protein
VTVELCDACGVLVLEAGSQVGQISAVRQSSQQGMALIAELLTCV